MQEVTVKTITLICVFLPTLALGASICGDPNGDGNTNIEKGHQIATDIENEIKRLLKIEPTIHVEPRD